MPEDVRSDPSSSQPRARREPGRARAYWRANLRLMAVLLAIWFLVSFGFGILLRDWLDRFSIGGAPLGFWFAQQGAIYVFVALIFIYVLRMNALDEKFGVEDDSELQRRRKRRH